MNNISTIIYAANAAELKNEALYNAAYHMATKERQKKTDSLRFENDRQLSIGAELLLIEGLRNQGMNIREMIYYYGTNGKPYLTGDKNVYFNLSHSKELVICAVSSCEIGCDIEKVSDINLDMAKRFFTQEEYEAIAAQKTEELRREMFFRFWTLKESFLKLTGVGISMPMNSFCIRLGREKISVDKEISHKTCCFQELNIWQGYKSSVCGFDKRIGSKEGVSFEILKFSDILRDD